MVRVLQFRFSYIFSQVWPYPVVWKTSLSSLRRTRMEEIYQDIFFLLQCGFTIPSHSKTSSKTFVYQNLVNVSFLLDCITVTKTWWKFNENLGQKWSTATVQKNQLIVIVHQPCSSTMVWVGWLSKVRSTNTSVVRLSLFSFVLTT